MFDDVPVRVWLLIAIAVIAFTPARYIYRHVAHSPSRRDIFHPSEDLSWRTSRQFVRSLTIVAILVALAVFIFTPTAEQFARSPRFWPILMATFGAWAVVMVLQGIASGRIELLMRGFYNTYERAAHPKRYWASMTWNALLGCLFLWLAYQGNEDASAQMLSDRCIQANDVQSLHQQLAACDDWISLRPHDPDACLQRGLIFLDIGASDQAKANFTRAHELDPKDPWPLANRGLVSAWKEDRANAEADFALVRSVDPSNPVMLRGESLLQKNAGDLKGAVERLTESMKRDPNNLWALRTRSELYWELGEHEKSARDDQRWVRLKEEGRIKRN